ncbi:type I glutamate--ammonia ligase [Armatimonadetes bacterium Uphvl-Ar1]|nr:type I glutamate--ammonia ligase [Armatimonadetes bacterium Uphvl-Ar1]
MTAAEAIDLIESNDCEFVDIRFTDPFGMWHHFTMPTHAFTEETFADGLPFDGSSIRGFKSINESDMLLKPDPTSVFIDPFFEHTTAVVICDIEDPITHEPYSRDPRYTARKGLEYLNSTGIADTAYFGPEPEFFVFDKMAYSIDPNNMFFAIDSMEASWNSGKEDATGYSMRTKGGYFPAPPSDKLHDMRSNMILTLENVGIQTEIHHHEVGGAGQCEIDFRFDELLNTADKVMKFKYVVKNVAAQYGCAATFMPKPLFGDNGSGMHVHQSLWKNGENLFYDRDGYGGLSEMAIHYIGGILKHAPALLAFTNPSTNSYRRLVPGYEAPINLVYSARNRSACIRIPMVGDSPKAKRIEFRAPDPTANPYLAFTAMMMAGLDGIINKIEPPKPVDKDLYELAPEEKLDIPQTPGNLREVLQALRDDHEFLTRGDVFTEDLIDAYINFKLIHECDAVDLRPHPMEFYLYNDI